MPVLFWLIVMASAPMAIRRSTGPLRTLTILAWAVSVIVFVAELTKFIHHM